MNSLAVFQTSLHDGEVALIFSGVSRHYLSGFRSSDGVLLVTEKSAFLYLDSRYFEMAQIQQKKGLISSEVVLRPTPYTPDFKALYEKGKAERIYLEDGNLTYRQWNGLGKAYPNSRLLPLEDRITCFRIVKTAEEIRRVAEAQRLAEEAFSYVLPRLKRGRTEVEIAAELEWYMKSHGASGPSFETICVSGSRSSLPHGRAGNTPIGDGFLTMDFGCVLDGYCSDMTRTVCLGKATEKMRLVYDTVLQAQKEAIEKVVAGVCGCEVDRAARDRIASAGFGEYFGHSTGHGIGLQVHEEPSFSSRNTAPVPAGAILSVEPGIYLPGEFGVRIEDLVVVTDTGSENLNQSTKELLEL